MSSVPFYVDIIRALEEIGAPYMIVGAFGGYAFGISRTTYDIDILVDLRDQDFDKLSQHFPLPRYYADPEMMRSSTESYPRSIHSSVVLTDWLSMALALGSGSRSLAWRK